MRRVVLGGAKLAPCHQRFHLLRVKGKGLAQIFFGRGGAMALPLQDCQVDPAGDQIRSQFDGSQQGGLGVDFAPLLAQQAAQVDPCGGKVRAQGKSAAIASLGLLGIPHARQRKASGKFNLRHPRTNRQRLLVALQSLFVASQTSQRISQAHVCRGQRGLAAESQLELSDSILATARGKPQFAQAHVSQRIRAVQADGVDISALSLIVPVGGLESLAQRNPCGDHARRGGDRGPGHPDRGLGLAAGQRHQGDAHQRLRVTGVLLQHALATERHFG